MCHLCPPSVPARVLSRLPTMSLPSSLPGAGSGQTDRSPSRLMTPPSPPLPPPSPRPPPPPLAEEMTSVSEIEVPMLRWRPELDTEATASSVAALAEATAATVAATAAAREERRGGPAPGTTGVATATVAAGAAGAADDDPVGVGDFSSAAVEGKRWRPRTWNVGASPGLSPLCFAPFPLES